MNCHCGRPLNHPQVDGGDACWPENQTHKPQTKLEAAERLELEAWGVQQLQEQEDRAFVTAEALKIYIEELGGQGERLGEVAGRRLAAAKKLLKELT